MKTISPLCFKKAFPILILLFALAANLLAQPQYYNYNTAVGSNAFPFGVNSATGKSTQTLYLPGAFNQPTPAPNGNITKLYIMASNTANATFTQLTIKMGLTTDVDLPTGAWYTTSMTTVFDQSNYNVVSTADQFFAITLTTPFAYDNTKSLVVEITQCGYSGTGINVRNTSLTGTKRHAGPLTAVSCPHPWGNSSAITTHTGVDIAPPVVNCNYAWGPQTSGTTSLLYSVKAVNGLVAWAAGAAGTVRKTTDGGATWGNGNPNPGIITGDVYNIEAIDANTAWCTTSPGATFIYKTTNGGTNWVQVFTQAAPSFINAIKMATPLNGYASGDVVAPNWVILGTTDGGSTWTQLPTAPAGTGDGRNNCLQVSLPNIWFGTGQGTCWRSTNAGVNWSSAPTTGLTGQVLSIRFNSATLGLCGGATLVRTTDGGLTFAAVTAPGTGNISGIDGSGNNFWYVRGTGIYRSTDAGLTWTSVHTAVGTQNDIKLANDANGCLVGWSAATLGNIAKMTGSPVGIVNNNNQIPNDYMLAQNYPNPFNPTTNFIFALPKAGYIDLKVYDVLGREAASIVSEFKPAGSYTVEFNASQLSSGVYYYTLRSGDFTATKKMVLIK